MKVTIEFVNKLQKIIINMLFVFLIIIGVFLILQENRIFKNIKIYTIVTESMEPTIKVNDIIIVKKCSEEELMQNAIITFKRDEEIITHRIAQIVENNNKKIYVTKGDNNNVEDNSTITYEDIIGKKICVVPQIGKITILLKNTKCLIIFIIILLLFVINKIANKRKKIIRKKQRQEYEKSVLMENKEER